MAPATAEEEKRLFSGLDYLGKPSDIGLTGTSDVPAGATGLPAPSAPGGMAGFAGGAGGPITAGRGQGQPDIAGFVQKILGKVGEGEGDLGARGDSATLSDQARNPAYAPQTGAALGGIAGGVGRGVGSIGGGPASALPMGTLGESLGFTGVSDQAIMNMLNASGLGAEGIQGLLGEMNIPQGLDGAAAGATGGATAPGAVGGSTAGTLAGMAIGPLLSYLGTLATKDSSPEMQAAISGLTQALAPVAAPAVAGAVTGATAGTGALSGAASGLAAAGPGLIASAPMAAMIIATSINNMLAQQKLGGELTSRAGALSSSIPGHIAKLQSAPDLLAQLGPDTTPEQAAAIYKQAEDIFQGFQGTGMEDFLKKGYTSVTGPSGMGSLQAEFPGGPELYQQLSPGMQALDVARIRAQDIAARGGQPIAGGRSIYDYGFSGGGPAFSEAIRPGSTDPRGELAQFLLGLGAGTNTSDLVGRSTAPEELAAGQPGASVRAFAGIDPSNTTPVSMADMMASFSPGGANYGRIEPGSGGAQYMQTNYGLVDRNLYNQLAAIQPGNYEQGLAALWKPYGGGNQGLDRYGFGGGVMPAAQASPLAAQIGARINAGAGTGLAEGMLTEEERRRLSQ